MTFDEWCLKAQSDEKLDDGAPIPLMTVLFHRVCCGNKQLFMEAVDMLRLAFEAGRAGWPYGACELDAGIPCDPSACCELCQVPGAKFR